MLDKLKSTDFAKYLNQTFRVCLDGIDPIELELVSVTETGEAREPGARKPFSIQFLGPHSSQYLIQHIYHLEHEEMDALDLFIVPLGPKEGRMCYEAIVN